MLTSANKNKLIAKTGNLAKVYIYRQALPNAIFGEFGHLQANMNERHCANEQRFDAHSTGSPAACVCAESGVAKATGLSVLLGEEGEEQTGRERRGEKTQ